MVIELLVGLVVADETSRISSNSSCGDVVVVVSSLGGFVGCELRRDGRGDGARVDVVVMVGALDGARVGPLSGGTNDSPS